MSAVGLPPLPKHLLVPDARYGWSAVARNLGGFVGLLVLTPALAGRSAWASMIIAPSLGLMMYRMTVVMHDCAHGTLFSSRRLNRFVGTMLGAAAGISFRAFTRLHRRHHRRAGLADDPQGPHYLGLLSSSRGMILWHLVRPLLGHNLLLFRRMSAELSRAADAPARRRLAELVLIAGVQFVCAAVISRGFISGGWRPHHSFRRRRSDCSSASCADSPSTRPCRESIRPDSCAPTGRTRSTASCSMT